MRGKKKAILALADGRTFSGWSLGAEGEAIGEVVFNTSLMGYQEIVSDPSYAGQIVTMTYPLIGNYGINPEDLEARTNFLEGFVVREGCPWPSNWRSKAGLHEFLAADGIVGIEGIDTRALTKHIREQGAQIGIISTVDQNRKSLAARAAVHPVMEGLDLVQGVSCEEPYKWNEGVWNLGEGYGKRKRRRAFRVVAYDYGIKHNIMRNLVNSGFKVDVVPALTRAEDVLAMKPDAVFLSNGPGDPAAVTYAVEATRRLVRKLPVFGICLGHQILCLALGGRTYKLKYGHHGGNQPVMDLTTGKVEITVQNHGFAVDIDSLGRDVVCTHINLNDRTVEGMAHKRLPVFSVQYHPEASPGPHDASYLFDRFYDTVSDFLKRKKAGK